MWQISMYDDNILIVFKTNLIQFIDIWDMFYIWINFGVWQKSIYDDNILIILQKNLIQFIDIEDMFYSLLIKLISESVLECDTNQYMMITYW